MAQVYALTRPACPAMAQKKLVWQIGLEDSEADGPTSPTFVASASFSPPDQGRSSGNAFFSRMRLNRSIQERRRSIHRGFR